MSRWGTEAKGTRPDYVSFMLRLWRVRERDADVWRASLQHPQTGERVDFPTLEELFAFLRQETGTARDAEEAGG